MHLRYKQGQEVQPMVTTPNQSLSIPPLENSDRLSLTDFERRYKAMPQVKKANHLVAGLVYMASLHC
ncbi:hypothetical protein [Chroococcidiopsis sp. TS-821]|uniref:hypothetical protein n=1 Tax=Chroococcidiopsis sp. TS-821 TaxID=1378066 RepID=UPI001AEF7405|nr:hypothetical protein [Chroococcidiopsis sp. TS-821]